MVWQELSEVNVNIGRELPRTTQNYEEVSTSETAQVVVNPFCSKT
jgi:hypothetical protein